MSCSYICMNSKNQQLCKNIVHGLTDVRISSSLHKYTAYFPSQLTAQIQTEENNYLKYVDCNN